jgi:hypothetical protein
VTVGELKDFLKEVPEDLPIDAYWEGQDIPLKEVNFGVVSPFDRDLPTHFQIYAESL